MDTETKLEIAWRKELLARLQAPLNVLQRKVDREELKRLERAKTLSYYESAEEAHEAYGYGEITYSEYEAIKARFEGAERGGETMTAVEAALEELHDFMRRLHLQVRDLEWSALPDEEIERIHASNEAFRAQMQARKAEVPT